MKQISIKNILIILLLGIIIGLPNFVFASETDGTIDSTYKYAWGENVGWINFGTSGGNVHVTDSSLTGYAWSANHGWINLNPPGSGVSNNSEGTLSGSAWGENTGWIDFSGVTIDDSGYFFGYASGTVTGQISFNCSNTDSCSNSDFKVATDWRHKSTRALSSGRPTGYYNPPAPSSSGSLGVVINQGDKYTNDRNVNLTLNAGDNVTFMIISENGDFSGAGVEDYVSSKTWILSESDPSASSGQVKTIYAQFYTQYMIASDIVSDAIILDTQPPEIQVTDIKDYYEVDEEIILSGTIESEAEIILHWDEKYSLIQADSQGKWTVNLGKLSVGKHELELKPKDLAGNAGESLSVFLEIKEKEEEEEEEIKEEEKEAEEVKEPKKPIIERIKDLFKPKPKPEKEEIITVPEKAPLALRGRWNLLSLETISRFVLAPLPRSIRVLAKKFPELEETFARIGIKKITDVEKLKTAKLILPGMTEALGLSTMKIKPGEFALPQSIPIAELSAKVKRKLPTEIVFAKTGGEVIDFNTTLTVTKEGRSQQKITTISGKFLHLTIKPARPVKSVKGYIVFKSKKPRESSMKLPSGSLAASLFFANPVFAQVQEKPVRVEEKLVLLEFEYTDPDGDGIYTAEIQAPIIEGEYEVITVMDFEDIRLGKKEIRLITVVDPEGYIYEKDKDKETRIPGAIVSIYWLNPEIKQYELWPAKEFQQENPQITDTTGKYSFLVPEGSYYLKVEAPGYLIYDGKPFQVKEGSGIHVNIELKTKYWWLKILDWKTILLIAVVILLFYNFYRDKIRAKSKKLL